MGHYHEFGAEVRLWGIALRRIRDCAQYARNGNYHPWHYLAAIARQGGQHLLVPYAPKGANGQGRLYARAPAAQTIPKPWRALLFATDWTLYDIVAAHPSILAHVAGEGPGTAWLRDPRAARRFLVEASQVSADMAKELLSRAIFTPAGKWDDYVRATGFRPPRPLADFRRAVLRRADDWTAALRARGYEGPVEGRTPDNALYHACAAAEAAVVATWRAELVSRHGAGLGWALIHDALLLPASLPRGEVELAFAGAAFQHGFPRLRVAVTDWAPLVEEGLMAARSSGWSAQGRPWQEGRTIGPPRLPPAWRALVAAPT